MDRRITCAKLSKQVHRWLDVATGCYFFVNVVTGTRTWTKPLYLHTFQGDDRGPMPEEGRMFQVKCQRCDDATAETWCDTCEDAAFCPDCWNKAHAHGQKYMHRGVEISLCSDCGYQVVTRSCRQCGDEFCDNCFLYAHRRGRRMDHTSKQREGMLLCEYCREYTARYGQSMQHCSIGVNDERLRRHRCYDCDPDGDGMLLCKPCLRVCHETWEGDDEPPHTRIEDVSIAKCRGEGMHASLLLLMCSSRSTL